MDKFIATIFMLLALVQAEVMFAGAFTISTQTNWPRLGSYFHRQIVEWQEGGQEQPVLVKSAKKKTNRHINLSTSPRSDAE